MVVCTEDHRYVRGQFEGDMSRINASDFPKVAQHHRRVSESFRRAHIRQPTLQDSCSAGSQFSRRPLFGLTQLAKRSRPEGDLQCLHNLRWNELVLVPLQNNRRPATQECDATRTSDSKPQS